MNIVPDIRQSHVVSDPASSKQMTGLVCQLHTHIATGTGCSDRDIDMVYAEHKTINARCRARKNYVYMYPHANVRVLNIRCSETDGCHHRLPACSILQ